MINSIKHIIYLFVATILFLAIGCAKDTPSSEQKDNFIKFYGDAYDNSSSDIIKIDDTYYMLYNHTNDDNESSFFIQSMDEYGNKTAKKQYKGIDNKNLWGESLISTSDNRIAVVGYVDSNDEEVDSLYTDVYLLIVDYNLEKIRDTVYNDTLIEKGFLIAEKNDGGLLIYGTQKDPGTDVIRRMHRPLNNLLEIENPGQDGIINNESVGSMLHMQNGEFLVTGNVLNISNYEADILHLDLDGKYNDNYLSGLNGFYHQVIVLNETQIVICGVNYSGSNGQEDGYIALFDIENRSTVWEKDLGGGANDGFMGLALTSDYDILVAGYETNNVGIVNISVKKLDVQGNVMNEILLGGEHAEQATKIFADENNPNSFIVFGNSVRDESSTSILLKTSF